MANKFISGPDVWSTIWDAASAHKSGPRYAAVAYVSSAGSALLAAFGRGDMVVCNAGPQALYTGSTDPDALAELLRRKVRVVSVDDLHAKVFVFDQSAIIGSANASQAAVGGNVEAATVSSDATLRSKAREFIDAQAKRGVDVDARFVKEARRLFLPMRRTPWASPSSTSASLTHQCRVLVWEYEGGTPPKAVTAVVRASRPPRATVGPPTAVALGYSWEDHAVCRVGDYVIDKVGDDAYSPSECVAAVPVAGSRWTVCWFRYSKNLPRLSWQQLRGHVLVNAGRAPRLNAAVNEPRMRAALFDAWGLPSPDGTQKPF